MVIKVLGSVANWNRCDTKADRKVCRNINKLNANRHMVKLKKLLLDEESVNTK